MPKYDVVPDPLPAAEYLTVVIRDDGPMVTCGDSPSYRSVRVYLTPEQKAQLVLRATYFSQSNWHHENVSGCFLEAEPKPTATNQPKGD